MLKQNLTQSRPLAAELRPQNLNEFVGQTHILGEGQALRRMIEQGSLQSMILWGPPGTGKTTLAYIMATLAHAQFLSLSAVMSGVKEIREAVQKAQTAKKEENKPTLLFVDEVHRFNKSQQDAFLPFVEDGTLTFIGATTENPSFELNNALLSRCAVYVLQPLEEKDLLLILKRATDYLEQSLSSQNNKSYEIHIEESLKLKLVQHADQDARQLLNMLEMLIQQSPKGQETILIDEAIFKKTIQGSLRRFDKGGEHFYDQISALHKAVRGSSPDGALYWYARMLDGGCDPLYIARRVVRMATEDIGNADPRALEVALNAWETQERLGSPEGELAIAQAIVYMAVAPKSNAVYIAFAAAKQDAKDKGSLPVPLHIRNAPTKLMKNLGYGKEYRYDHDEENAFAAGQTYFPEALGEQKYYHPVNRGLEIKIKEKLDSLRAEQDVNS